MDRIFHVALWRGQADAVAPMMPTPLDKELKRVSPESLTRILRTISAFECLQRELSPPDTYEWNYNLGQGVMGAALLANEPDTIAEWFQNIGAFARPE